jgi:hypothetical protein
MKMQMAAKAALSINDKSPTQPVAIINPVIATTIHILVAIMSSNFEGRTTDETAIDISVKF